MFILKDFEIYMYMYMFRVGIFSISPFISNTINHIVNDTNILYTTLHLFKIVLCIICKFYIHILI